MPPRTKPGAAYKLSVGIGVVALRVGKRNLYRHTFNLARRDEYHTTRGRFTYCHALAKMVTTAANSAFQRCQTVV